MACSDVHSMIFSCEYKDQGWGNKKGKIYITEKEDGFSNDVYDIGAKITESPTAEHETGGLFLNSDPNRGLHMQSATLLVLAGGLNQILTLEGT